MVPGVDYPQTASELAAAVKPKNYGYAPGDVRRYGALGDGVHDDTEAIQAALAANPVIFFHNTGRSYLVSKTLTPTLEQVLYGLGSTAGSGPSLQAAAGMNEPIVKWTTAGAMRGLDVIGSATSATTGQHCVHVSGTNNVTLQSCFFSGGYHLVHIDGTSFYTNVCDCVFHAAYHAQLYVSSSTAPGVDMILRGTRFLQGASTSAYCVYMKGLGSLIWSDVQMTEAESAHGCLVLDQPAPGYGGAQFTNCVFENSSKSTGPAVQVIGAASAHWDELRFVNSFINGESQIGLDVCYCDNLALTNCALSSTNAMGAFYTENGSNRHWTISDSRFDGAPAVSPIQCGARAEVSGSLSNCFWNGTAPVLDYGNNSSHVGYVNVLGVSTPNARSPVRLASDTALPGTRILTGAWFNYKPTLAPESGSFGDARADGWYIKINQTIHWYANLTITAAGSATGGVHIGLPSMAQAGPPVIGIGREIAETGKAVCGFSASAGSSILATFYDDSSTVGDGFIILIGGTYNAA
jgi:hypothetical protein